MNKNLLLIFLCFLISNSFYSQVKLAPDYLINKKFPEKVLNYKVENTRVEEISIGRILEKFKGKKIVIDFWASWCKDCIEGIPNIKKLTNETKDVVYIYFSLDKSVKKWKKAIKKHDLKGYHYFMPEGWKNTFTDYIKLDWIPRYMIISKYGKVINPKAIKVTDSKFRKDLRL